MFDLYDDFEDDPGPGVLDAVCGDDDAGGGNPLIPLLAVEERGEWICVNFMFQCFNMMIPGYVSMLCSNGMI